MKKQVTRTTGLLLPATIMAVLGTVLYNVAGGAENAAAPAGKVELIDMNVTKGADVAPAPPDEFGMKGWLRLQQVRLHLAEIDSGRVLQNVSCQPHSANAKYELELRGSNVDCTIFDAGGFWQPLLEQVDSMTFTYRKDQAKQVEPILKEAVRRVGESYPDAGFRAMPSPPYESGKEPACIPPYHSPCVVNPVCKSLNYCSRSAYSCQQCT